MKLGDTEKAILLGILGVAIAILAIIYVAKPNWEETQSINSEITTLQAKLADLQSKQADREFYLSETERYEQEFDRVLNSFPPDLNQEITIMFMQGIKDNNDFTIGTLGLGQQEQFYTLGMNGGDATLGAAPADAAATEAASTDAAATEAAADPNAAGGLTVGEAAPAASYDCYRAAFPLDYTGSYESLKDVVTYVDTYADRMTVNSIDISYDAENDRYRGSLNVMCYAIESTERTERNIDLNQVEVGVDNIFNGGSAGSGSSSSSLNKYDENDGAALESNYDFYAMLNPATSDVSAKVVGQNGTGKEASVISNSDNTVSTLSFEFYEKDGKNYCKYTLDNSKSYEAEVTAAEDIKLLIQSSARKDAEDKVGIRVSVSNSTKLPVYVKVSGDDTTSPRVNVTGRTGSVKVYK